VELEETYRRLADGDPDPGDLSWSRRALHQLALDRAVHGDPDQRLAALKVSIALGARYGLPVVHQLVEDPDPRVRTLALNQAVAAREDGLPSLRRAASGADPELALVAFELLVKWVDPHALGPARRALSSGDPRLRARGAELLGLVAGKGLLPDLQRLQASDPDPAVRAEAERAARRILGQEPRSTRAPWWDVAEAGPATAAGAPQLPATVAAPEPEAPASSGGWPMLPSPLPTETRALTRLLGMVGPEDRGAVIAELQGRTSELAGLWAAWAPGDRALSRGLAMSAATLGYLKITSRVVAMLTDPDPDVRAIAAECLGAVGAPGSIPPLAARLGDAEPAVAVAAIRGLTALALRFHRPGLARDQLARMAPPKLDEVRAALDEARARLG
jgi:HEAT repeat protein